MTPYLDDVCDRCRGLHPTQYPEVALRVVAYRAHIHVGSKGWSKQAAKLVTQQLRAQAEEVAA